jgi:hypothetical protein
VCQLGLVHHYKESFFEGSFREFFFLSHCREIVFLEAMCPLRLAVVATREIILKGNFKSL